MLFSDVLESRRLLADAFGIAALVLVDATNDRDLMPLHHGQVITLEELPTRNLTVRATTYGPTESVRFNHLGRRVWTENHEPFALHGDTDGDYNGGALAPAIHRLVVESFAEDSAQGAAGEAVAISFLVRETAPDSPPEFDGPIVIERVRSATYGRPLRRIDSRAAEAAVRDFLAAKSGPAVASCVAM